MTTSTDLRLGSAKPRLSIYIPHLPEALDACRASDSISTLLENNSNHWRKIVTLAAKVAAPDPDWRRFRDQQFLQQVALVFSSTLEPTPGWHWIGGRENQSRFGLNQPEVPALESTDDLFLIPDRKLLLTPYPDYRQLSNQKVAKIRQGLHALDFYSVR